MQMFVSYNELAIFKDQRCPFLSIRFGQKPLQLTLQIIIYYPSEFFITHLANMTNDRIT